ncbi:Crp/Fnr family transcriptional regulator [Chitinophaga sp. RAB17]|uniref:Crp/Fnr family transcriptional regulator n=1 Tax=Chitinophaga sp. RAB17 TaxID=3233049 RepID=UPI003F8FAACE
MTDELLLQNIARHIHLEQEEVDYLFSLLTFRTLKKKEFLLRQGDVCKTENFIAKGCVRMYTIDESGFEHIVMFGVEGWWTSDLFSFFTSTASDYYIDALEDTDLWQISKDHLDQLYEQVPKFERFFRILLQNAFIAQQKRINQNLSFTAEQRYVDFVKKYPQLEQRIPQKQVAAYLGMTPVFLSMLRKKQSRR